MRQSKTKKGEGFSHILAPVKDFPKGERPLVRVETDRLPTMTGRQLLTWKNLYFGIPVVSRMRLWVKPEVRDFIYEEAERREMATGEFVAFLLIYQLGTPGGYKSVEAMLSQAEETKGATSGKGKKGKT